MELAEILATDVDLQAQSIILAASQHDYITLKKHLRGSSSSPANVKDPETGFTPLHAAIAACDSEDKTFARTEDEEAGGDLLSGSNGCQIDHEDESPRISNSAEMDAAEDTMRLLLQNGAIWNELDKNNETPGCLALRLGLKNLYEIMVDAGVRAEMLLNRLDEYERLNGEEDEDADEDGASGPNLRIDGLSGGELGTDTDPQPQGQPWVEDSIQPVAGDEAPVLNSETYLKSGLTFSTDRLLDDEKNGVMMTWETEIMRRTAEVLVPTEALRILNVGHGMGIIDELFQTKSPISLDIIEAHPDVISKMKQNGWYDKPGVSIHEGRWQHIVPSLMEHGRLFDSIYFDTFAEDYSALKKLFDEYIIGLLDDKGRWSFFNGLGADRQICYDVYTKVVEMDLLEAGFDVEWETLGIPNLVDAKTWEGLKRPYWKLKEYKLPVVTFLE